MRPLLDNAKKDDLPTGETLLGGGEARTERGRGEYDGARLHTVELDDEVLIAPYRDEEARRVGDSFNDPAGVAPAQTGALETRMSIEIGCSHSNKTGISTALAATGDREKMTG